MVRLWSTFVKHTFTGKNWSWTWSGRTLETDGGAADSGYRRRWLWQQLPAWTSLTFCFVKIVKT